MKRTALALIILCFTQAADAAQPYKEGEPNAKATVGVGVYYVPDYLGSEDYEFLYLPYVDLRYKRCFANAYQGLGCTLYSQHGLTFDVALGMDFGRDEDENARLNGLGDIDPAAEGRLSAHYRFFGPGYVSLTYRHDLFDHGHEGFLLMPKIGMSHRFRDFGLLVDTSVIMDFASEEYMQNYFGISQDQASNSVYTPFKAAAGWRSAGLGLNMVQDLTEQVALSLNARYLQLLGDANDSPIVKNQDQYWFGLSLIYRFD